MHRLVILMYHIIATPQSIKEAKYCCDPSEFEKQMKFLASSNYQLMNLDDIHSYLKGNLELKSNAVAVTFDDGFDDFHHTALPILVKYNIPATIYIVSNKLGTCNDWMAKNGLPRRGLLSNAQLSDISNENIVIGSHTRSHPKLIEISGDKNQLTDEIALSKTELEEMLGKPVNHFAYPYGLFDDTTISAVRNAGYLTACSTRSGFNRLDIDPFLLRRVEVYGSDTTWAFKQKLKFGTNNMSITFPFQYYFKQAQRRLFKDSNHD